MDVGSGSGSGTHVGHGHVGGSTAISMNIGALGVGNDGKLADLPHSLTHPLILNFFTTLYLNFKFI